MARQVGWVENNNYHTTVHGNSITVMELVVTITGLIVEVLEWPATLLYFGGLSTIVKVSAAKETLFHTQYYCAYSTTMRSSGLPLAGFHLRKESLWGKAWASEVSPNLQLFVVMILWCDCMRPSILLVNRDWYVVWSSSDR